jgi:hypothetical protein
MQNNSSRNEETAPEIARSQVRFRKSYGPRNLMYGRVPLIRGGLNAIPSSSYLAAVTDSTEMTSPLAVPLTLASSQASLFSSSRFVLLEVSRV